MGGESDKERKGGLPARPEHREMERRPEYHRGGEGAEGGAGSPHGAPPGAPWGPPPWPYAFEAEPVEEINILRYINILLKRRWLIIGGCFVFVLLAAVVSLKTPPTFTASAKFLPSPRSDMTARMGTIIGTSGRVESFEENLTSEYYVALMQSNIFLERIAERTFFARELGREVNLVEYYTEDPPAGGDPQTLQRVIERSIRGNLSVSAGRRTGGTAVPVIVTVSYSAREPGLAAAVVNAFLDEAVIYNQDVRESKTRQNREFIEKQIAETTDLLARAENELADFTSRNKRIATPDLEVELERLKRNVRIQEEVYISLKKQLELAKIEEQERKPAIEVIERAMPPLSRSAPQRRRTLMIAGFLSLFLFCGLAFAIEWIGNAGKNKDDEKYREFFGHIEDIKKDASILGRLFRKIKRPRR